MAREAVDRRWRMRREAPQAARPSRAVAPHGARRLDGAVQRPAAPPVLPAARVLGGHLPRVDEASSAPPVAPASRGLVATAATGCPVLCAPTLCERWAWPTRPAPWRRRLAGWLGSCLLHGAIVLAGASLSAGPRLDLEAGGEAAIEVDLVVTVASDQASGEAGAAPAAEATALDSRPSQDGPPAIERAAVALAVDLPLTQPAAVTITRRDLEPAVDGAATDAPPPAVTAEVTPPPPAAAEAPAVAAGAPPRAAREGEKSGEGVRALAQPKPKSKRTHPPVRAQRHGVAREAGAGAGKAGQGRDRSTASVASIASGSGGPATTAGRATLSSYQGTIIAHLARHKRYPEEARARGIRGRSLVSFTIDGSGRVTRAALAGRSGSDLLDRETEAMVRRASPFPPIPPDVGRTSMSFTAPVSFTVRDGW